MGKAIVIKGANFSGSAVSTVPTGYQRVKSIRAINVVPGASSLNAIINTGVFIDTLDYKIKWGGKYYEQIVDYQAIFSDYDDSLSNPESQRTARIILQARSAQTGIIIYYNRVAGTGGTTYANTDFYTVGKEHEVELTCTTAIVDGKIISLSGNPVAIAKTAPMIIAAYGFAHEYFSIERNGEVCFDGIPCRRLSDSSLGIYDRVSQQFLTVGSGIEMIAEEW